jgi:hypothetical protein
MKDPGFWRDLRAHFEALEDASDLHAYLFNGTPEISGGPRDDVQRKSLQGRFRNFAIRGGLALGASPEQALEAWLQILRERAPHHVADYSGQYWSAGELRDVALADIIPPDEDLEKNREIDQAIAADVAQRAVDGRPPREDALTLCLEPFENRFVVTEGRHLFRDLVGSGRTTVKSYVGPPTYVETVGARIDNLRLASIEVCEWLETKALSNVREHAIAPAGALKSAVNQAPPSFPRRAAFLQDLLDKNKNLSLYRISRKLKGPSPNAMRRMLDGKPPKDGVIERFLKACSADGVPLTREQIPND